MSPLRLYVLVFIGILSFSSNAAEWQALPAEAPAPADNSNLPRVKWVIRSFTREEARDLLQQAWLLEEACAIRELYNSVLEQGGLGGLVRAGN